MGKNTKNSPKSARTTKRCSAHKTVQNFSMLLIACLLVVTGMMLRG